MIYFQQKQGNSSEHTIGPFKVTLVEKANLGYHLLTIPGSNDAVIWNSYQDDEGNVVRREVPYMQGSKYWAVGQGSYEIVEGDKKQKFNMINNSKIAICAC